MIIEILRQINKESSNPVVFRKQCYSFSQLKKRSLVLIVRKNRTVMLKLKYCLYNLNIQRKSINGNLVYAKKFKLFFIFSRSEKK